MKVKKPGRVIWMTVLGVLAIIMIAPVLFALSTSLKGNTEVYQYPLSLFPRTATLDNYLELFRRIPVVRITFNTFLIATITTTIQVVTSFLAAYAFAFFSFKGKRLIYFLILIAMFIPFTVLMIPNYLTISSLGLKDNLFGAILPQMAAAAGVFLMNQAMRSIPRSLIESCRLENVGHFRIMREMVLPMIKPQFVSTGIWYFVGDWNEYVWPQLVLKTKENYTLPLALELFSSPEGGTDYATVMAMSVLTMILPLILYLVFQRYIVATFTSSGVK